MRGKDSKKGEKESLHCFSIETKMEMCTYTRLYVYIDITQNNILLKRGFFISAKRSR